VIGGSRNERGTFFVFAEVAYRDCLAYKLNGLAAAALPEIAALANFMSSRCIPGEKAPKIL